MTTPKVRAAWPIGFTPADLQRAPSGERTSNAQIIATGNVIGVVDDNPGKGTWDYRIRHPSGDSGEWGPWASIAVAEPGPSGDWTVCTHSSFRFYWIDDNGITWFLSELGASDDVHLLGEGLQTPTEQYTASGLAGASLTVTFANGKSQTATMPDAFTVSQTVRTQCRDNVATTDGANLGIGIAGQLMASAKFGSDGIAWQLRGLGGCG